MTDKPTKKEEYYSPYSSSGQVLHDSAKQEGYNECKDEYDQWLKGISVEAIELIKELKHMIYLSKSPMMDNSHILDTRKADKILNRLYKLIQGE